MEERVSQATTDESTGDTTRGWRSRRQQAADALSTQRSRLDEVESLLTAQIESIGQILSAGLDDNHSKAAIDLLQTQLEQRQAEMDLAQQQATLELQAWSDRLKHQEDALQLQQSELAELTSRLKLNQRNLELAQEEHDAEGQQLARRKARFEEQQNLLESELEALEHQRSETKNQRHRIALQLKSQRDLQLQELDVRRAELDALQASLKLDAERVTQLARQELDSQAAELDRQRQELRLERIQLDSQISELAETRRQLDAARQQFEQSQAIAGEAKHSRHEISEDALVQLRVEYERLQEHCQSQQLLIRSQAEQQVQQGGELEVARAQSNRLDSELAHAAELAQAVEQELSALRVAYHHLREEQEQTHLAAPTVSVDSAAVQSLSAERDSLISKLQELQEELSAAVARTDDLDASLQAQLALNDAETSQAAQLSVERDSLSKQVTQLETELYAAQERVRECEESLNASAYAFQSNSVDSQTQTATDLQRDEWQARIESLNAELEAARKKLADHEALRDECGSLRYRLEELNKALQAAEASKGTSAPSAEETRKQEDLQRRFEMAVDDVRSLKRRNAELEDEVSALRALRSRADEKENPGKDWESLKRRMLAQLEADTNTTPQRSEERISIESTIRITDQIVASKDQEIADLRKLLQEQSNNLGEVAVGTAAIAAALDQDELIQAERERLRAAAAEWRDKLRQAEIDISLERARIARDRAELEEKLQQLESDKAHGIPSDPSGGDKQQKPQRGRWLERLGLKESDRS
ncbi:MAG: hypothetical protein SGJ20_15935 [Planctomycetota bacterium]|nr:hypothetical protein [Planctomycetota bacterium]